MTNQHWLGIKLPDETVDEIGERWEPIITALAECIESGHLEEEARAGAVSMATASKVEIARRLISDMVLGRCSAAPDEIAIAEPSHDDSSVLSCFILFKNDQKAALAKLMFSDSLFAEDEDVID